MSKSTVMMSATLVDGGIGPQNGKPRLFVNDGSIVVDGKTYTFPRGTMVYLKTEAKAEPLTATVKAAPEAASVQNAVRKTAQRRAAAPTADAPPADLDAKIAAAVANALASLLK